MFGYVTFNMIYYKIFYNKNWVDIYLLFILVTNVSNVNIYPIDFCYKPSIIGERCVSTNRTRTLSNWIEAEFRNLPLSFIYYLPIRQSWLESSFVWLEQGGDYQWHLSSATYHRSGAVLAYTGPAENMGTVGICTKQYLSKRLQAWFQS